MMEAPTSWLQNLGIAIEVACPTLALIAISLRLYIRIDTKTLGWGIHYWDAPLPMNPTTGMIWIYIVGAVYNPILALVKQSVLIFLIRFSGVKDVVRYVVWVTATFNLALMIATFVAVIFQCTPIEKNWKPTLAGSCIQQFSLGISTACLTILTDLVSVGLPSYVFLGLKMQKKRKIGLMIVFMLGIIVTAVSVIRLYFLAKNFTDKSLDANFSLGFCVSSIESSAPALWPLIRRWMPQLKSSKGQGYYEHQFHTGQQGWIRTGDGREGASSNANGDISLRGINTRYIKTEAHFSGSFARDSDEELMIGTGIMRTTNLEVTHDDHDPRSVG
ncbi:integral membrane protein [Colletotrichum simmondsii]|uniref:Integral membrane protein n=1 Tax=Colletotrichum simmondsii TaxID=703756 RepID=A0A135TQ04_9PEZI|nr:integral membrane protein [Colletotrichum simmondsii]